MLNNLSSVSRNKASVFLLVFALIVGGVGAQATGLLNTKSGGYLLCVNPSTKAVTHPGTSTCPKGSRKLVLGAEGAQGVAGAIGLTGAVGLAGKDGTNGKDGKDGKTLWNGVNDPENTLGVPGDMFINTVTKTIFGPKNLDGTWPAGVSMVGPSGGSGPAGPQGNPGTNATIAITELSVCDGADADAIANEKCKIGMTGPGGGFIFFVDYNDQYAGFNYLEAAPSSCEATRPWSSANTSVPAAAGWAARAVGAGSTNTAAIKAVFTLENSTNNAAYFATECSAGAKSDWFLGSLGEMKLIYDNLQGLGGFVENYYWSSSEANASLAWLQSLRNGLWSDFSKGSYLYVRPVRAF